MLNTEVFQSELFVPTGTDESGATMKLGANQIGANLNAARSYAKLTQAALARRTGISRTQIVKMEAGQTIPQLDEAVLLADTLHIPIQQFLSGKTRPAANLKGIAHELYELGIRDLVVSDAAVPGAFRRPEQVICLALRGDRPEIRILEAMPYVLSRHRLNVKLTLAFADLYDPRVKTRIAWLSDVTLTIARKGTLSVAPDVEQSLERITASVKKPKVPDGLGHPSEGPLSPVWRRWNITYAGTLKSFAERSSPFSAADRAVEEPDAQGDA